MRAGQVERTDQANPLGFHEEKQYQSNHEQVGYPGWSQESQLVPLEIQYRVCEPLHMVNLFDP